MRNEKVANLFNKARELMDIGNKSAATDLLKDCLQLEPNFADAYCELGVILASEARYDAAIEMYEKAYSLDATFAEALFNKGLSELALGRVDASIISLREVLLKKPFAQAQLILSRALLKAGSQECALFELSQLINRFSAFADAYLDRGSIYMSQERFVEALKDFGQVIALNPKNLDGYINRARAFIRIADYDSALIDLDMLLKLDPLNVAGHFNRGLVYQEQGDTAKAEAAYRMVVSIQPENQKARCNLSVVLKEKGDFEASLMQCEGVLKINPVSTEAKFNLGIVQLLLGDFEAGLVNYESRLNRKDAIINKVQGVPFINSVEECIGSKILVFFEQGLGDTIQFCPYVEKLAELGVEVIFAPQRVLHSLLKDQFPRVEVVTQLPSPSEVNGQISLLSLPLLFGLRLTNLPYKSDYISADRALITKWSDNLGTDGYKIGICWQGSTGFIDKGRSFHLRHFEKIGQLPNVRLVSLHKGAGTSQMREIGFDVETLPELDSEAAFVDTAAVMKCLDLVITSDSAVAHLAGALGVKVWVVLQYVPDWRWFLSRIDCPWYPSARLYRQFAPGDWTGVFDLLYQDLIRELNNPIDLCSAP